MNHSSHHEPRELRENLHRRIRELEANTARAEDVERTLAEAEEVLHTWEQHYLLAQRLAGTGTWEWRIASDKVIWSDNIAAMWGYAPGEFNGTFEQVAARIHPDDLSRWRENVRACVEDGVEHKIEMRIVLPDGSIRWLAASGNAERDEQGKALRMLGVVMDITERKQAEQALRESESLYRTLFEAAPHAVFLSKPNTLGNPNPRALEIFGCSAEELTHTAPHELSPPTQPDGSPSDEKAAYYLEETLAGRPQFFEWRHCRKDGSLFDAEVSLARVEVGGEPQILATLLDITERKRAEDALKESQRILSTLMSNLPGMAYRCRNDEAWTMVFVSDGCRDLTGYTPQELLGNRRIAFQDLIREDHRDDVRRHVGEAIAEKQPFELHYPIHTASGTERWVWERGRGVFDDDGTLLFLEGFMWDVTHRQRAKEERTRLEDQLRQAQKMEAIGQLAGGVAHDFNNILTAIFGHVELAIHALETRFPDATSVLDGLRQVEKSAQHASSLTRQLLAFSRRQMIRPEVVDLNAALRGLEKMLSRLISEDIQLDLVCEPDLAYIKVDPGQLEQVVINLVVNARDAMPVGGRLTLRTGNVLLDEAFVEANPDAQIGPHVLLAVSDTGAGMDRETIQRIFEPFFTTKPAGQGTGLGLSTVYGIVKQADGHITVDSAPQRGTTFNVYLPIAPEPAARPDRSEAPGASPTGSETILICEDDVTVRSLTADMLKAAGYSVLVSANAGDALQIAAGHAGSIELLLTDVIMPEMNGRKLSDAVSSLRPGIRTLFVSGYTSSVIAHHGVLDDGVEFLEKPFSRRDLLQRVREVLDRPQA